MIEKKTSLKWIGLILLVFSFILWIIAIKVFNPDNELWKGIFISVFELITIVTIELEV